MNLDTARRLVRSGHINPDTIEKIGRDNDPRRLNKYLEECRAQANREFDEWVREWNRQDYETFRPLLLKILPGYMRSLFKDCAGDVKAVKGHIRQQATFWEHYDVTAQINQAFKEVRDEYA